jgi:hypothetical protein
MVERTLQVARLSLAIPIVDEAFEETSQTETVTTPSTGIRGAQRWHNNDKTQLQAPSSETKQTSVKTR